MKGPIIFLGTCKGRHCYKEVWGNNLKKIYHNDECRRYNEAIDCGLRTYVDKFPKEKQENAIAGQQKTFQALNPC